MKSEYDKSIVRIEQSDPKYMGRIKIYLGDHLHKNISALGSVAILEKKIIAFFCSVKCPGQLILRTYDLAQHLKQAGLTVIGGFHSPIERECLTNLLRGSQPVIICPARSIKGMRMRKEFKGPLEERRLLFLSPFKENQKRYTVETAIERNHFVAAIADAVFVAHASANSKMEKFCHEVLTRGKRVYTFESESNSNLIQLGAKPMNIKRNLDEWGHFLEKN